MRSSARAGLAVYVVTLLGLPGAAIGQTAATAATIVPSTSLQEVVVTAEKRSELLQDAPVPVTSVSATSLIESNMTDVKDFYTSVPGLSIAPGNLGGSSGTLLSIRGLTTGSGNPTVGIVVDDVPFGASTTLGAGGVVPEFDPSDLASIEVLRGPQGTLYGANSIGGLVKYVTVDPSTQGLSGRIEVGGSGVKGGNEPGYNVRGAVNVPLGGTAAVRVSGFLRRDPGYIDNIQTGQNAVNRTDAEGGLVSLLWLPAPVVSVKLNAIVQDNKIFGFPYTDTGLGDLQQSDLIGTGVSDMKTQAYSLIMRAELGIAEFTSLSGYSVYQYDGFRDYTFAFGGPTLKDFGVKGDKLANPADSKKYSQEFRLSLPIGAKTDWLMGLFYTHEQSVLGTDLQAVNPMTGATVAGVLFQPTNTTYQEYAAFTDLTYRFTDQFDVQFGGRASHIKQDYSTIYEGPYTTLFLHQPNPFIPPDQDTDNSAVTYLLTPRYKISPNLMLYARLASGYRPGGPNNESSVNKLPTYAPDKTQNYELGFKGNVLDRRLSFDASIYYIDWKNIQLQVVDPTTKSAIFVNAGGAKSQGVELSVTARPVRGLTVAGWIALDHAELTRNLPAGLAGTAVGLSGERLPDGSRISGHFSLEQDFLVTGEWTGFAAGELSYVGDRLGNFQPAGVKRPNFPGYAQLDLRAGTQHDLWTVNLFLNNITDKRGVLPSGTSNPVANFIIQPRTIGLNVTRTFSAQ